MLSMTETTDEGDLEEEEEDTPDNCKPTTPLHRKSPRGTCDTSPVPTNHERNTGFTPGIRPSHNNNNDIIMKELNERVTSGSDEDDDDDEDDEGERTLTGGDITGGVSPPSILSKFSSTPPTKKLPFFRRLSRKRKRKKKRKNLWQSISEIPWGSNTEAILVGVAAFMTNFIIIGFIAALSIYYVEFKQAFTDSHGLIPLSVFLPTGVFGSVGLLSGIFLNRFGVRITGITGSLLLAIGIGACSYANNVIFLLAFLGVMAGTGCSLVYLSVTMAVCAYFKHKGRLLMPLVTMGEAFGTIIFPPLTSYFIQIYFWRGSLILMSGVMLQAMVCTMIYSIKNLHQQKSKDVSQKQTESKSFHPPDEGEKTNELSSDIVSNSSLPTQNTSLPLNSNSTPAGLSGKLSVEELNVSTLMISNSNLDTKVIVEENSRIPVDGSLKKVPQELEARDVIHETNPGDCTLLDLTQNSDPEPNTDLDDPKVGKPKVRQRDTFKSIVKNKQYMLFLIAVFIMTGCINTTQTVLPDFCVHQGLTLSDSANIFAIGASGDVIARVIGGWLLFRGKISSLLIFTISGMITGFLVAIYPLVSTYYLICVLSFFLMLHSGLLFSVYSVVVLDFFDIDRYAIAIGLSETVAGFGVVLFGYVVGLITEYNDGSYVVSFYIISVMSVACMLPMLILALYRRKKVSRCVS